MKVVFLNGVRLPNGREWTVGDQDDLDEETAEDLLAQGVARKVE